MMVLNFADKLTHQIQARFHTLHFTEVTFQHPTNFNYDSS